MFYSAATHVHTTLTPKRLAENEVKYNVIPSKRRTDVMHKSCLISPGVKRHFLAPVSHAETPVRRRPGLWQKLLNNNIKGKCLNVIRSLYANIKSKVMTDNDSSAYFPCMNCVRQGENLSPILFI